MSQILIHTTSIIEAKPIIDFFNLQKLENSNKNEIYSNNDILLIISGVSKDLIVKSLDYIFKNYSISKAFDLSIASCSDGSIALGTLFCTNRFIGGLNFANVTTVEQSLETDENLDTLLVDKQALFFSQICKENIKDFYILKIVSDYFDEVEPTNEKIFELINNSILKWKNLI
ncbi:MAG: hypothetical protein RBQ84_10840 [Arcobacter sp.]|jgi:hypothetical protein|uniref:hypothetical protein n=1 Tax=unclassified Arcobacter TaxID=2593671 RepID=UPI00022965EA|nr:MULTISPECIES: hypothetical protein [unclassified Arcobacter]MDY3201440.1 hypothetical protein [Arcobacter sp.]BAK74390.1 hypothetical protein ABLL_2515 [Arcobacter sp. L]